MIRGFRSRGHRWTAHLRAGLQRLRALAKTLDGRLTDF